MKKKLIIIIGLFLVLISAIIASFKYSQYKNIKEWKSSALTSPKANSLSPAGHILVEFKKAKDISGVKKYEIYIDDKKVCDVDKNKNSSEIYLTKTKGYKIKIVAITDKEKIESNCNTIYVNKKGLCMNKEMAWNVEADKWGASWYYNWSFSKHNYVSFRDLEFVPMIWSKFDTDSDNITLCKELGYRHILAYNEPDAVDQSDIPVDDAVEGMKDFQNKGLYVGLPATALMPEWSKDWFKPFMKKIEANNLKYDFIPVHHYWNWYDDEGAEAFLKMIDNTYNMYHKPIWVTEFAISGVPRKDGDPRREEVVIRYMKKVIEGLEKRDYVERYAWFSFPVSNERNSASAMLNTYTGKITDLGKQYIKIGMPKGYKY